MKRSRLIAAVGALLAALCLWGCSGKTPPDEADKNYKGPGAPRAGAPGANAGGVPK